jgi:hypothetical protein
VCHFLLPVIIEFYRTAALYYNLLSRKKILNHAHLAPPYQEVRVRGLSLSLSLSLSATQLLEAGDAICGTPSKNFTFLQDTFFQIY